MISAKIAQIVAGSPTVVTSRVGTECCAEGIDRAVEDRSQRMLERRASRTGHEEVTGRGRKVTIDPADSSAGSLLDDTDWTLRVVGSLLVVHTELHG
jgi:hypothetical protein